MLVNRVERGRYLDSVALMRVSRKLEALDGVKSAAVMIGSPSNRELLRGAGLLAKQGEAATPNDLIIAILAHDERSGADAMRQADALLSDTQVATGTGSLPRARGLGGGLGLMPQANLVLISVPGEFAAHEARRALERGLHVLLFSDNVPLEDEAALKRLAGERGLLMMGPDCGTAIVAGTPLAFANVLPRGDIGIVSASGTGLQEVAALIARMGGGLSHGIGVGGRDLDARIGALGTLAAIDALAADPATAKIVLISKPPAPEVALRVLERIKGTSKPCVVCFLGMERDQSPMFAGTLTEAAEHVMGKKLLPFSLTEMKKIRGKRVEGLYCGGTLCAEAELIFRRRGLSDHRFVDLGDDEYTRGRPHPMIEPEIRNDHVARAMANPEVGLVLVDVVLGFGAHENPAGVLLKTIKGQKPVVASVTGTEQDPQGWSRQVALLREAGVLIAASNAHAAELAAAMVS
ncbi:MAG TPA: acyl-CoA synthetase FdrA [Burkholderiales bacterium]|jgi:FdrA protein|nr:acyl-CoA synthetase FdrA [Burkholderiales bacterium]